MAYRVVYGETRPAWEKEFPTKREAERFANKQKKCGDIIYSVEKVDPVNNPGPHSIMSAIAQAQ